MWDPYGALPHPHVTFDLIRLIKRGHVYSLAHAIDLSTPVGSTASPFSLQLNTSHNDPVLEGPFGEATEILTLSGHASTHIEALCHISEKVEGIPLLYGDLPASEVETAQGFTQLGIEDCPPILTRGILLDLPEAMNREVLPDSYPISTSDLQDCLKEERIKVQTGDCILIRTGFSKYRSEKSNRYATMGPGPDLEACQWIAHSGAILTGSDTMSFERIPGPHIGHIELVRRHGISILKQLNLEALSADRIYEFLLVIAPLKLIGATASPVNPIAVC